MIMKKLMMTLAAVLCCAMTTTVFTSCGSDDDKPAQKPNEYAIVAVATNYTVTTTDEMLSTYDITIDYYDADGTLKNHLMTEKSWDLTVTAAVPTSAGMRIRMNLKEGKDLSAIGYVKYLCWIKHSLLTAKGQKVNEWGEGDDINEHIRQSSRAEWLDEVSTIGARRYLWDFDAAGNATGGKGNWR